MKQSQNHRIMAHFNQGGTLTPLKAFRMFGCLALHSRISELRHAGLVINTRMVKINGKRVGQYSMA